MSDAACGVTLLARTGSSRLPGKSLLDLCGRPVLAHQLDRLKLSRRAERIGLATTTLIEDDALCDVAHAAAIEVFRGAPNDVLRRLGDAADVFRLGFLVVAGGDDVMCEGELIDEVIAHYEHTGDDFITMDGLPFGTAPFGLTVDSLRRVLAIRADEASDGWERFFTETGLFKVSSFVSADRELHHPEIRLDLDYPEDYELLQAIYGRLYDGDVPSLRRVLRLLVDEEPALAAINRPAHEKWLKNRAASWPPLRLKPEALNGPSGAPPSA